MCQNFNVIFKNQSNFPHSELQGFLQKKIYRDQHVTHFPVISKCTLQGSSGTQGNPVNFTAKTFAV